MEIKIKYHEEQYGPMERISAIQQGDWIDLRAAETISLKAGEHKLISFGISIELPQGYEANIVPRSSTFKKWGILQTNSYGVIDNSYCGDEDIWMMTAYATRDTVITKGDRIAQFRINAIQPSFSMIEVESLQNESRGGFGSTGVN